MPPPLHVDIYSDGARLDPAGPVGWACEVVGGGQRWTASGVLTSASVLLAEAHAAAEGVALALRVGATACDLFIDAQAVLDLVAGRHPHLLAADPALAAAIARLQGWHASRALRLHKVKAHTGGSSGNAWADSAARQALLASTGRRQR